MVIFHFIFDLKITGHNTINIPDGDFWIGFRNLILTLFMSCVGLSLAMAHRTGIRWRSFRNRVLRIAAAAALVSAMSIMAFPSSWIYFGVLHFVAVASLLCLPLSGHPRVALVASLAFPSPYLLELIPYGWPFHFFSEWLPSYSYDFVNPLPWLGVVCLGIWGGHQKWLLKDPLRHLPGAACLGHPGRHSLAIYLLHQPILLGALWLINQVLSQGSTITL